MSSSQAWRLVAGAVAALGVPAAVGVWWRNLVARWPAAAVALAVAWWLVLAVLGMLGAATAKVRQRRLEQAGEALDRAAAHVLSGYEGRYRRWVRDRNTFIDIKGLATAGDHTPRLEEVFVDVALVSRAPHAVSADPLAEIREDACERYSIEMFLDRREPVVLAVVGPPGCGKTTLLTHVAQCQARQGRSGGLRRRARRNVPVMLALRDHVSSVVDDAETALPNVVRAAVPRLPVAEPAGWWDRQLERGRCLVLLDGLDEVAREQDRRVIAEWIEKQIDRYPDNHFVITSRPHGYRSAAVRQANVVTIQPFTLAQVEKFLRSWYLAIECRATGARPEEMTAVRMRADEEVEDLLLRLRRAPALADLTMNPLLLTMIAHVHRYRGALPGSRAELYGEICQVMLSRRLQAKKLPERLPWPAKENLLRLLAFQMMTRHVRDLPRDDVLTILAPELRRVRQQITGPDFLDDVACNGLLVEREHGLYAFAHLSFQEYLAARHIQADNLLDVLTTAVADEWWRETTLLYAATTNPDPIVQACLDDGGATAMALAFDCSTDEHALAPELRDRLRAVLQGTFEGNADPAHRRLVAAVLAARLAREVIITTTRIRVGARPVPTGLYWLFLHDTNAPAPDSPCPPDPESTTPVTGVWGREALAFVSWLNKITTEAAGQARYRLPTGQELNDPVVQDALASSFTGPHPVTCLWTHTSNADVPGAWRPSGRPDPHQVTGSALRQTIAQDIVTTPLLLLLSLTTALDLAHARARDLDLARDQGRDIDAVLAEIASCSVGRRLGGAMRQVLAADPADAGESFAAALAADAGIPDETQITVPLDGSLSDRVRDACAARSRYSDARPGGWDAAVVTDRLAGSAEQMLDRRHRISEGSFAARIRLAALALTDDSDPQAVQTFRELAAAATLLEQRANGRAPVGESLVLALI